METNINLTQLSNDNGFANTKLISGKNLIKFANLKLTSESLNKTTNLNLVTDDKLIENLKSLATQERKIHKQIILHIAEVDRRKLYLTKGFSSLFEYLTDFIGFSRGTAQRCIDAARLFYDVPEVINHIENGTIKLSQVSLLQQSFREVQAKTKTKVSTAVKKDLVTELIDKSVIDSQVAVKQRLDIDLKQAPKIQHQKDESVRLEVTLSKSQWQKLEKMRELLSNSVPSGTWDKVLEYVSEKVIQQKDKTRITNRVQKKKCDSPVVEDGNTFPKAPVHQAQVHLSPDHEALEHEGTHLRKHISKSTERLIYNRDQCCQFNANDATESTAKQNAKNTAESTNKICGSKWQLNIDHIKPVWAGGTNDQSNLRVLCGKHNRYLYRRQSNLNLI